MQSTKNNFVEENHNKTQSLDETEAKVSTKFDNEPVEELKSLIDDDEQVEAVENELQSIIEKADLESLFGRDVDVDDLEDEMTGDTEPLVEAVPLKKRPRMMVVPYQTGRGQQLLKTKGNVLLISKEVILHQSIQPCWFQLYFNVNILQKVFTKFH